MRIALAERLSDRSLSHCDRVADLAAEIAVVYDVDVEEAHLAGLLHDWSRDTSPDELLEMASEIGVTITAEDEILPYLLHAKVASAELGAQYPEIPVSVLHAVETHTCGADVMSSLDKAVYVADMIEPNRTFPGVQELRKAVGTCSLDELFRRAYTYSLLHLIERRRHIHPDTVSAWNSHVAGDVA